MRMRSVTVFSGLTRGAACCLTLVLLALFLLTVSADLAWAGDPLKELEGIWVPEASLKMLRSSLSPHQAKAEMIIIAAAEKGRWKITWSNYHEGTWRYILKHKPQSGSSGHVTLLLSPYETYAGGRSPKDELRVELRKDRGNKITSLIFQDATWIQHQGEPFVRIPVRLERYAAELLLSGSWQDADNKKYIFSPEGTARWPEGTFPYEVSLDASEAACDYLLTPDTKERGGSRRVGFRRTPKELFLYRIVYDRDAPISCEEQPFVTLKRTVD